MPPGAIVAFVVIFALILLAVSVGLKFFEERRKKQVANMLQTAAGDSASGAVNILRSLEPERQAGIRGVLESMQFSQRAEAELQQAGMNWSATGLLTAMGLMAFLGLGVGVVFPFLLNRFLTSFALAGVCALIPYLYVKHKRSQRLNKLEEQFPEALDFLARSMRAGHAFSISLEMIGEELADPLGQEFRALFNEQNLGAPLELALRNFAERVPLLDARFFTSSVLLQRQTGGNLAEILSRLSYVIRERFQLKGQVRAASAHGRMTAGILTILPVGTMVGLLFVAPGYLQGMAADPDGKMLIAAAIIAQIVGNLIIKKIINIKV